MIRMTAVPNSCCMRLITSEYLGLNGDIERRGRLVRDQQRGSHAIAIAIIARWRMPPEN